MGRYRNFKRLSFDENPVLDFVTFQNGRGIFFNCVVFIGRRSEFLHFFYNGFPCLAWIYRQEWHCQWDYGRRNDRSCSDKPDPGPLYFHCPEYPYNIPAGYFHWSVFLFYPYKAHPCFQSSTWRSDL